MSDGRISRELRGATLSGARWTAGSRLVAETLAFSSSIVLARLVPPAEFGHAAVALIVVALSAVLGTAGFSSPLVQKRDLTGGMVAAVTLLALVSASALTAVTIAVAEILVRPVFADRTADLVELASPAWILVAIGSSSQALLQRSLRFGSLAVIETISVLAGAALAVGLAVAGADGEALVGGGLALVGVAGLLSFALAPLRAFRTDRTSVRDTFGFALPVALSSLVYVSFRNIDYAILGARTTATQVGYYWRAFQLGVGYQSKISRVMLRVSFPVYSRASGPDELRAVRTRIVRGHATVLIPLLAFFIAVAPVVVPFLFGPAWEPSVRLAQILAVAGMSDAVVTGIGPLLVALGRPGALLRWNLVILTAYAAMVYFLAPHGVEAVAIGAAVFGVGTVVASQVVLLGPYAGLSFRQLWADTRAGLVVGTGVLLAAATLRELLERLDLPPAIALFMLGALGAFAYVFLLRLLFHAEWADLRAVVGKARRVPTPEETLG